MAVSVEVGAIALGQAGVFGPEAVHLVWVILHGGRIEGGGRWNEVANGEGVDVFRLFADNSQAALLANFPGDVLKGRTVGVGFNQAVLLDRVAIGVEAPINPDGPGEVQSVPEFVLPTRESQR